MTRRSRIAQPPLIVSQTESLKHVHVKTFSDGFRVWHPLVRNYVGDQTMSPFRTMQDAARRAREIELEVLTSGGVPSDGPSRSTAPRVDPRQGGFKFNGIDVPIRTDIERLRRIGRGRTFSITEHPERASLPLDAMVDSIVIGRFATYPEARSAIERHLASTSKLNDFYSSGSYDPDDPRPARRASHQHHHHGDAMPIGRAVDYSEAQHHHGHHTPSYDYEAISSLKPNGVAPWSHGSQWYEAAEQSIYYDDRPAFESLNKADRSGDPKRIARAEARLAKLTESRLSRIEAEARRLYALDAERGIEGTSMEHLRKPNPYVVAERRGRPAIDVVFPKRTEAGLARRYLEGSEGATGLRVRAATPAEIARLRKENPGRGRALPATVERCVAHVGPRRVEELGPREGLSSAIAICTAQGQRRGQLRKGTRKPTKKGRRDQRNARRRVGFAADERAVARMARAARKANGVDGLTLARSHGRVSAAMKVGRRAWSAVYDPTSQAGDVSLNGEIIGRVAGPQRLGDGSYDFDDYHATVSLSGADSDAFDVFRARLAKALLASAAKRPRKGSFRPTLAMPTVDLWDRISNGSRRWTSPAVDREGRDVVIEHGVDIDGQHVEAWAAEWREGWPNIREVARFTGTMREATEGLRAWHQKAMVA